jgi:hypothetical protein
MLILGMLKPTGSIPGGPGRIAGGTPIFAGAGRVGKSAQTDCRRRDVVLRAVGAIGAALGFAWIVAALSSTVRGYPDGSAFLYVGLASLIAWLVLFRIARRSDRAAGVGRETLRSVLGAVAAVFLSALTCLPYESKIANYRASMMSDLRNLSMAEDDFHRRNGRYVAQLPDSEYATSFSVTTPDIRLTADGWTASVRHSASPQECAIYVGSTSLKPARKASEPACTALAVDRRTLGIGLGVFVLGTVLTIAGVKRQRRRTE